MKQVTIVGLGLIGASLGLALKQLKNPPRVIGNDTQYDTATRASKVKAVDRVERYLPDAVVGSDVVVVATPISEVAQVLQAVAGSLEPGCVVTDTGSTKREIVRGAAEILPSNVSFVGGHPMTGRATAGVDDPSASLFRDTVYCLTPTAATPEEDVARVASMIADIGAQAYFLDPEEHDGLVAGISHLPYLVSASLMRVLSAEASWREMSELAAGGFELSTRLAGQDPVIYGDMLATNSDNVARYLERLIESLSAARDKLRSAQPRLSAELEGAQKARIAWEEERRKALLRAKQ
ncbi:MAG TPA: prephenate dehydrogenase/arogenate dehydrogenase family protein [Chloroflexota bacterium]